MQAADLHVALFSRVRQGAQAVRCVVGVRLEAAEAEAAMFVEQTIGAETWSVPRGRQPDWFGHGRSLAMDLDKNCGSRLAGRMASTASAAINVRPQKIGS